MISKLSFSKKRLKKWRKKYRIDPSVLYGFIEKMYVLDINISCFKPPSEKLNNKWQNRKVVFITVLSYLF